MMPAVDRAAYPAPRSDLGVSLRGRQQVRIVHVNVTDSQGGAARAAIALHRQLLAMGAASRVLVQERRLHDPEIVGPTTLLEKVTARTRPFLDGLPLRLYPARSRQAFSLQWLPGGSARAIRRFDADIVHLHWLARGLLPIGALHSLGAPLVWTMHDMWAFTGGCHYTAGCERFIAGCGACPVLGSASRYDLAWLTWHRKRRRWRRLDAVFVAPSRWLAAEARRSSLLADADIRIIPNGVDTQAFRPLPRHLARAALGIPGERPVLLFGGEHGSREPRKGFDLLAKSLPLLRSKHRLANFEVVVFGGGQRDVRTEDGITVRHLGTLHDDLSLAVVYSAADVIVIPSRQDNLPNTALEALACGTPVVGFRRTGLEDIVLDRETGFLADAGCEHSLAEGIAFTLALARNPAGAPDEAPIRMRARSDVEARYPLTLMADRYGALYEGLLSQRNKTAAATAATAG